MISEFGNINFKSFTVQKELIIKLLFEFLIKLVALKAYRATKVYHE